MAASLPPPGAPPPTSGHAPALSPGQALAACHAAVLLFGFAGLFGKWIAWDAAAIVLGRTLVAAVALAVVASFTRRSLPPVSLALAVNGIVLAIHWTAFFAAIKVSTVAIGLLGFASFPLFVPWLERMVLGIPLTARKLAAMLLVTTGLALVVPGLSWSEGTARGLAWGIVSGATFALLTVSTQRLVRRHRAGGIAFWQNAVAAAVMAPIVALRGVGGSIDVHDLGLVLLLGLVCTALAHTLFAASLARLSATVAAVSAALEPVYGTLFALLLLGEVPTARVIAGMALIVGAAIVASWQARRS